MSRLPIRIRLTLPFALAMAVVLSGLGAFVYIRVGSTLLASMDQTLSTQSTEATLRLKHGGPILDRDAMGSASVEEVIGEGGTVVSSDPEGLPALLDRAQLRSVLGGRVLRESTTIGGESGRWRLLAIMATGGQAHEVLVLGGSLRDTDESLEQLRHELLFSSPLALLVATVAGYLLAGGALRPVEIMRKKAAAISAATPGARLPALRSKDEMSRLADTLNEMLGRLEAAIEHERKFIAEASHELRTPLALLRTELELALRKPRSREELEDALRSAAEETDRLTALAADLLFIARSDEKAIPVHPETISAHKLLATVAGRFSAAARDLGRDVTVTLDDDFWFDADPERVEQALGNLVDNALLHGAGTVTLSAERARNGVELHVTDEGPGFPSDFAARAFDRFSRAAVSRSRAGSGLGLAIVQAIAIAHDGTAAAANTPRGGADVVLWLPGGPSRDSAPHHRGGLGARLRRATPHSVGVDTAQEAPASLDETRGKAR